MSSCLQIRLRGSQPDLPTKLKSGDGFYYLDVNEANIKEDLVAERLNDLGKIDFNRVIGTTVPPTSKNVIITDFYIDPTVSGQGYQPIPIDIIQRSTVRSDIEMVVKVSDDNGIKIDFQLDANHWARRLQGLKLCDVIDEILTFDCSVFTNYAETYQDGAAWWNWPLVDYGRLATGGRNADGCINISPSYFRPTFWAKPLVEAVFCKIGYRVEAPIYETDLGRAHHRYLLNCDFGQTEADKDALSAKAAVQPYSFRTIDDLPRGAFTEVSFTDIEYDAGGGFSFTPGNQLQNGFAYSCDGSVSVQVRLRVFMNDGGLFRGGIDECRYLLVRRIEGSDEPYDIIYDENFFIQEGEHEFILEADNVSLNRGMTKLSVIFLSDGSDDFDVEIRGGEMTVIGNRRNLILGNQYSFKQLIDPRYNALDFIKGESHIFNFDFITDVQRFELKMLTPQTVQYNDDTAEGFQNGQVYDWTEKVIPKFRKTTAPKAKESKRYARVQFADSSDCYIQSLELEEPLYSRKVDFGEDITNEDVMEIKNPFYEPTANVLVLQRTKNQGLSAYNFYAGVLEQLPSYVPPFQSGELAEYGVYVPRMCESEDEAGDNFCIAPRALISFGRREHKPARSFDIFSSPTVTCINIIGCVQTSLIPTSGQFYDMPIGPLEQAGATTFVVPTDRAIVFSDVLNSASIQLPNHYVLFYERDLLSRQNESTHRIFVDLTVEDIDTFDFRGLVKYTYNGKPVVGRVLVITDVDRCLPQPVFVDVQPITQNFSPVCGQVDTFEPGLGNPNNPCSSLPILTSSKQPNGCILIGLGGVNPAPIDQFTIAVSDPNATITPLNGGMQYEVCLTNVAAIITGFVSYEPLEDNTQCPNTETPQLYIDPCGNTPVVKLVTKVLPEDCENCVSVTVSGTFENEISSITGTVIHGSSSTNVVFTNIPTGPQPSLFIESADICVTDDKLTLTDLVITYTNGCPPFVLQNTQETNFTLSCEALEVLDIECERDTDLGVLITLTGATCLGDVDTEVFYQTRQTVNDPWGATQRWDGGKIYANQVRIKRQSEICNLCPPICTDWKECAPVDLSCQGEPTGSCINCVWRFDDEVGRDWRFYEMLGWGDENDPPIGQGLSDQVSGAITVDQLFRNYPVRPYDAVRPIAFDQNNDRWYVFVGRCPDGSEYIFPYFHDIFQSGTIDGPIDLGAIPN